MSASKVANVKVGSPSPHRIIAHRITYIFGAWLVKINVHYSTEYNYLDMQGPIIALATVFTLFFATATQS